MPGSCTEPANWQPQTQSPSNTRKHRLPQIGETIRAAAMAARAGRGSWPGPCDALASSSQSPVPAASKVIISTAPGSRDRPPPGVQPARADHELHGGRRGRVHAGCPRPRPGPGDRSAEGPDDHAGRQAIVRVLQASLKQHLVTVSYGPHILARQLAFRPPRRTRPGRAGPARIRFAPPLASSGDTVRHSSSSRHAAASCPFRVGPPSASTRAYPRSASAPSGPPDPHPAPRR